MLVYFKLFRNKKRKKWSKDKNEAFYLLENCTNWQAGRVSDDQIDIRIAAGMRPGHTEDCK